MKIGKIKFKKIGNFLSKLPRFLGERAFLTFLGFLIIFLAFSGYLYYKYIFLVEKAEPEPTEATSQLNEKKFQKIMEIFEEKRKKFEEADKKQYPDPFKGVIPGEEAPLEGISPPKP